jgi:fumarate hydratase subunit alpha
LLRAGSHGSLHSPPPAARQCGWRRSQYLHPDYAALEQELLEKINALDIGPQGFGGQTTALGVNIETYATHIAGLPVAVNVGCHVTRHATKEL